MGGVEVPQAPRGVVSGATGAGSSPLPRKFFVFLVENTIF